jgi:hypothetical protein
VNLDGARADAERLLAATGVSLRVLFDPRGETPERYGVQAMPFSYLIDRDGNVAAIERGFHESDVEAATKRIEALLKQNAL